MSHFTVIVVGGDVARALQPFHEFECTGTDDEYIVNVDRTEEVRAEYETRTSTRLRGPDGSLHAPYDDRFYRDPTPEEVPKVGMGSGFGDGISWTSRDWNDGRGYRAKVRFVPDGYVEVEAPEREIRTFAEYAEYETGREPTHGEPDTSGPHKYGWVRVDAAGEVVEIVRRTNPNKQWDWWVIGGRWTGYFTVKPGADGSLGKSPTVFDEERAYLRERRAGRKADTCRWGDVDREAMAQAARDEATAAFAKWERCFTEHGRPESWETLRDRLGVEAARIAYREQPAIAAYDKIDRWGEPDRFGFDRDIYVERQARRSIVPFAILKDGVWHEKGSMGWWGCVSDEKSDWIDQATEILNSIDPSETVTLVDCHI